MSTPSGMMEDSSSNSKLVISSPDKCFPSRTFFFPTKLALWQANGLVSSLCFQTTAPLCHVQDMPTPTLMYVGEKDKLGDPVDNEALKPHIKNLVHYETIKGWNHLDFLFGKDAHTLLYPKLVSTMKSKLNGNQQPYWTKEAIPVISAVALSDHLKNNTL